MVPNSPIEGRPPSIGRDSRPEYTSRREADQIILNCGRGRAEPRRWSVSTNLDVQNRPENGPLRRELLLTPLTFLRTLRDDLHGDPDARPEGQMPVRHVLSAKNQSAYPLM
jgi:hypothetical protein